MTRASVKRDMMLADIGGILEYGAQLREMLGKESATRANKSRALLPDLKDSNASDVAMYKASLYPDEWDLLVSFYPGVSDASA